MTRREDAALYRVRVALASGATALRRAALLPHHAASLPYRAAAVVIKGFKARGLISFPGFDS